jgi:NDP-sugar pyrophosphorylase family protein
VRAVLLAGGFGTRLKPLTLTTPKQLLPLVDRPLLDWVVGHVAGHGITEVILALGYRPDAFLEAYPDAEIAGVGLRYAREPEPRGTAGAIRYVADEVGLDETFVVLNGDVLSDLDLGALIDFHRGRGAEGTIALHRVADPSAFGVVPTYEDGRVEAFVEKPPRGEAPTDLINAGTYVLEPSVIDRIPSGSEVSIERVIFPEMVADGGLFALAGEGYWLDTGTPEQYLRANLDVIDGLRGDIPRSVHGSVADDADVQRSVVGPGAIVASGATVVDSVVMSGADVGAGAEIRYSIVGRGAVIGAGARLTDVSVIGDDQRVESGRVLSGERVPPPTG